MTFSTTCWRGAVRLLLAVGSMAFAAAAHGQAANAPVRILVGFPPGGNVDAVARHLAEGMRKALGQSVVVENRAGAGGQVAAQALKQAAPDGNTLMLSNEHAVVFVPLTVREPGYDPQRDFSPVATVATLAIGLAVHPSTKATSLADLAAWARQRQAAVTVGVPAPSSMPDFAVGLIGKSIDARLESVSYRGGAPMVADLVGGHIPAGVTGLSELLPYHRSGAVRVVAVSGRSRSALLPEVPVFGEAGVNELDEPVFMGLFAPAGTPAGVVNRYDEIIRTLLASRAMREQLEALGAQAAYGDPDDLRRRMERTSQTWAPIIRQSGFRPQ